MAEDLLVTEQLTPEMIDAGSSLVTALDKLRIIVKGAFWLFLEEQRIWRLVIASPEVAAAGPKAMYRKVRSSLAKLPTEIQSLSTKDISVIDDKAPLFTLLRSAIFTGPGLSGIRFTRNVINGQLIADAYIYRLA